jgi:hypothetical protein
MTTDRPTTTALAIPEARALSRELAGTAWAPKGMNAVEVMGAVLAGQEMGLAPLQSIRAIHVIDGRPSLSSSAMMALAQRDGWRFRWTRADDECADCARRTTREQAREQAERTGVDRSWWIAPPTVRPCGQRVELERA